MKLRDLKPHSYNDVVFRKIIGDEFEVFKESIGQNGLQVRIEITSDNIILCGHQRVRALKELYGVDYDLDNSKIWIRKDLESDDKVMTDILQKERVIEDNQLRRHLNEGEMTMIFIEKKKLEKIKAKLREQEKLDNRDDGGKFTTQVETGKTRDKASEGLKVTGRTLENYERMYHLSDKKEKEHFLKTGKILPTLKKKYTLEKQRLALQKKKEANELRKKKLAEAKKKEEKERLKKEKQKKNALEEKIKKEKIAKEEAEKLRKEQEEERQRKEEEEEKDFIVHYKSSEKMDELDGSVQLVVTSPPYWRRKDYGSGEDKWTYQDYLKSMKKVWKECHRVLQGGCKLGINIGDQFIEATKEMPHQTIPIHSDFIQQCKDLGFIYIGTIIWHKIHSNTSAGSVMGSYPYPRNGVPSFEYEFILLFKKKGNDSRRPNEEEKDSSILTSEEWAKYFTGHWNFPGAKQEDHPSVFPDELPKRLIKMFSFVGDIVLDPFLGSGTTLKVTKELDRKGIGYELNKEYQSIIEDKIK